MAREEKKKGKRMAFIQLDHRKLNSTATQPLPLRWVKAGEKAKGFPKGFVNKYPRLYSILLMCHTRTWKGWKNRIRLGFTRISTEQNWLFYVKMFVFKLGYILHKQGNTCRNSNGAHKRSSFPEVILKHSCV